MHVGKYYILFAILFAVLAYTLSPHVPDGIEEKWKYRFIGLSQRVLQLFGFLYSLFASGDPSTIRVEGVQTAIRFMSDFVTSEHLGPGVTRIKAEFNGTKVYIYQPPMTTDQLLPGFIYLHGGGLAFGTAKSFDGLARKISSRLNAVVINVEYDTTPKNKFPGPINQCFAAAKWFLLHAQDYGVDNHRIAIGGDSAGGYLATAAAQLIYDDKSVPNLKLQILIYPWTQCLDFHFPSYQKYRKEFGIGGGAVHRVKMIHFCVMHAWGTISPELVNKMMENRHVGPSFKKSTLYKQSLGHDHLPASYRDSTFYSGPSSSDEGDEDFWNQEKHIFLDPRFTPHFRKNMTGLPTAYVVTAGFDSLRDEGYLYAQQLKKAAVDVTVVHYKKAWHGVHWISPTVLFAMGEKIHDDFLEFAKERL